MCKHHPKKDMAQPWRCAYPRNKTTVGRAVPPYFAPWNECYNGGILLVVHNCTGCEINGQISLFGNNLFWNPGRQGVGRTCESGLKRSGFGCGKQSSREGLSVGTCHSTLAHDCAVELMEAYLSPRGESGQNCSILTNKSGAASWYESRAKHLMAELACADVSQTFKTKSK